MRVDVTTDEVDEEERVDETAQQDAVDKTEEQGDWQESAGLDETLEPSLPLHPHSASPTAGSQHILRLRLYAHAYVNYCFCLNLLFCF